MNDATRPLTPATFDEWMAALDNYPKTKSSLHDDRGFCCLGVLADVEGAGWVRDLSRPFDPDDYDDDNPFEPEDLGRWATAVDWKGEDHPMPCRWFGAVGGELNKFLMSSLVIEGEFGAEYTCALNILISVNDSSATFEPVKAKAQELYAQWKAAQA